jgi:hypothetical protein
MTLRSPRDEEFKENNPWEYVATFFVLETVVVDVVRVAHSTFTKGKREATRMMEQQRLADGTSFLFFLWCRLKIESDDDYHQVMSDDVCLVCAAVRRKHSPSQSGFVTAGSSTTTEHSSFHQNHYRAKLRRKMPRFALLRVAKDFGGFWTTSSIRVKG